MVRHTRRRGQREHEPHLQEVVGASLQQFTAFGEGQLGDSFVRKRVEAERMACIRIGPHSDVSGT